MILKALRQLFIYTRISAVTPFLYFSRGDPLYFVPLKDCTMALSLLSVLNGQLEPQYAVQRLTVEI
jgi:hypothetical protein